MILRITFILNTIPYISSCILKKIQNYSYELGDKIINFKEFIIIINYIEIKNK